MTKLAWTTVKRKVNDLTPATYNPRQMTDKQSKDLRKSIEKFDLVEIPAVDEDGTILAGHQRLSMLQAMGRGDEEIDVRMPNRKLTDSEAKEYNLRSNKNTGEWDVEKLFELPADLLKEAGFTSTDLDLLLNAKQPSKEDVYDPQAELETPAKAKIGDLYSLGDHLLACGDSTDGAVYDRLLGQDVAAMMFTDPPYNIGYEGNAKSRRGGILNDSMSGSDFSVFLASFLKCSLLFTSGACYICMSPSELARLRDEFDRAGGHWQSYIIWVKNRFTLSGADYQNTYEPILYGWSKGQPHDFVDDRTKSNVWEELSAVKVSKEDGFTVIKNQVSGV